MKRCMIGVVLFTLLIAGCRSKDVNGDRPVDPDAIFFDYKIWGDEGNDNLTVMIQYRLGGENGDAVSVPTGNVKLDGEAITGDSSKMTGAFYEVQRSLETFAGNHTIHFTNFNQQEYKEEFNFHPMLLLTELPDTIGRDDIALELAGLEQEDYIRIVVTDTVFDHEGINRLDTVKNGKLIIRFADLRELANGPLQLQLIREFERPVKNGTEEGGRLSVSYGLRREFVLRD